MERKRSTWVGTAAFILFLVVCLYLVFQIVATWVSIGQQQQNLETVNLKLSQQLAENEELSRTLEGGTDKIVEQVARDELGYAKPNERVFVDVSGK